MPTASPAVAVFRPTGPAANGPRTAMLLCSAQGGRYAIPVNEVRGVQGRERLQLSPSARPDGPVGWLLAEQDGLAVYTLTAAAGGPASSGHTERVILVVAGAAAPFGLLVDAVTSGATGDLLALPPLARPRGGHAFSGVLRRGEELALVVDCGRLEPAGASRAPHRPPPRVPPMSAPTASTRAGAPPAPQLLLLPAGATTDEVFLGFSSRQIVEVMAAQPCLPVPGAPAVCLGLVSWRRRPVPLIDLWPLLGLPPVLRRRTVIARASDGGLVAFAAPAGLRLARLAGRYRPVGRRPEDPDTSFVAGTFELEGGRLGLLDVDRLVRALRSAEETQDG